MKKLLIATLAFLSFATVGHAEIISFAPNAFPAGGQNEANEQANGTLFSNVSALGPGSISLGTTNGGAVDFGPLILTDAGTGTTQSFNISIAVSTNNTVDALPIGRGGVGATGVVGGPNDGLVEVGETLTIGPVNLVPVGGGASLFQFDGYDTVFIGNSTAGEQVDLNGVIFSPLGTTNGTSFAGAGVIPLATTVDISGVAGGGGTSLNGLNAQFSLIPVVPEPSSFMLLGLGAIGLLARRRQ